MTHDDAHNSAPVTVGSPAGLVSVLQRRHEDYKELIVLWAKYQAVYTGGDDMKSLLIQHAREHPKAFKARQDRSFYFNYVKQIVDLFVSYLFRKQISRETTDPGVKAFWDNADGSSEGIEHPIGALLREVATFYLLFGKVAIVVDMPSTEEPPESERERKDLNLNPYAYIVKPQNITDWQYGEDGQLDWIRFEESIPTPVDPLGVRTDAKRWKYTTWTREGWTVHVLEQKGASKEKQEVEEDRREGEHNLGRVPVVIVMRNDNFKFGSSSGESLIKDIAISGVALFNLTSITGEEFYNHALNILVIQKQSSESDVEEIELSQNGVLEYEVNSNPPAFLAPSSVPVESLQGFMSKIVEEMKRMSRLGSTDSSLTGGQSSGLAQAFSFSDSNQALADTGQLFEEAETRIVTLVTKWLGKDPVKSLDNTKVEYPTDFGLSLFDDELATVDSAVQVIPSKTFAKTIKKKVAKKFLDKETPEIVDQVNAEIDASIDAEGPLSEEGKKKPSEGSSADKIDSSSKGGGSNND